MKNVADKICEMIYSKERRQPEPYDTTAEVRRVENGKAYVHLPGGIDETPVALTIDAAAGDMVQVRVADGAAWLVGNRTAPPTDDTTARKAQKTADKAETDAKKAEVKAEEAQETARNTAQYFWYLNGQSSEAGAHVTEVPQEDFEANPQGGNLLMRTEGIAVREGTKELATMTKDGFDAKTYDSGDNEVVIAHLGYGAGADSGGGTSKAPYYDLGVRLSGSTKGNYSIVEGSANTASGYDAHAEGNVTTASGTGSHCEGSFTTASGSYTHCEGWRTTASGYISHAGGRGTIADQPYQTAIGKYNTDNNTGNLFVVGNGTGDNARSNAFEVSDTGDATVAGELTASNIGAKNWVAPSSVSCQSGKWYKVAEVELDAGIWFIDCNALFPNTSATGTRQIRVTTETFSDGTTTAPSSYGNITNDVIVGANTAQYPQSHFPVDISSRTTFRLAAYQGSESTMSVTGRMYAVRIK